MLSNIIVSSCYTILGRCKHFGGGSDLSAIVSVRGFTRLTRTTINFTSSNPPRRVLIFHIMISNRSPSPLAQEHYEAATDFPFEEQPSKRARLSSPRAINHLPPLPHKIELAKNLSSPVRYYSPSSPS